MKKKNNRKIILLVLTIFLITFIFAILKINEVSALSKYGSTGKEVKQIQTKLKNWGYYKGNIDGIYGSQTLKAVKDFQKKNGLAVDGIVGEKTLAALGITSSGNSSNTSRKQC